jgi:D-amino-acid dehydrogenase
MKERVAVIGAGVVGLACATHLQIRGHAVTVVDPRPPGEHCSFGNAGCLSHASCVPLESERGYHVMLESPTVVPHVPIASGEGKYFATPMEGGLRIAGTVELASVGAPPDDRRADALLVNAQRLFPGLHAERWTRWMGHRPSLPDSLPVIGRSLRAANAWFAFGHGHVGLTAAAPTGEIVADLVAGREPFIDIAPFAADRF